MITKLKTLAKKLLAVRSEKSDEKEKKKNKTRMAITKLFALNANAKIIICRFVISLKNRTKVLKNIGVKILENIALLDKTNAIK